MRGAWDNVRAAAWHMQDGKLTVDWVHNTENKEDLNSVWGAMNHNMSCVDIDFDGKDEIISGPMAMDDDGSELYAVKSEDADGNLVKYLHGDAFDVAKMDPTYHGYLTWACHETAAIPGNIELHDSRTGYVLFGDSKNKDTGRSRAADIDPTNPGFELWGSTGTIPYSVTGKTLTSGFNNFKYKLPDGTFEKDAETGNDAEATLPMNFKVYWDGDLLSEFLDGTRISKYNPDEYVDVLLDAEGCASNSGT
jgi:rhamnogalacturonan endolyase